MRVTKEDFLVDKRGISLREVEDLGRQVNQLIKRVSGIGKRGRVSAGHSVYVSVRPRVLKV